MNKSTPLFAILLLGVIAAASFGIVYLVLHHHKPCKNGECIVKIDLGHLSGRERTTALNQKTFYSFQGIPYAKPPVESLRFKDPEPIEHWHTLIDATKEGNICLQPLSTKGDGRVAGDENCLFLNVYTTQFPDHDVTLHPVIVYFHAGGFTYGSAKEETNGADYLVEFDLVVVTVNYRLGALGFLSLDSDDIPGNAGLKDQTLALKWVRDHISHFGGDPNSVTIMGHSAGAASVQYHMLSPLSKGLFHSAIMLSGSALNPWAFEEKPVVKAFRLGEILGFNTTNKEELADFLRKKSAADIVDQENNVRTEEDLLRCLSFPFVPSIEKPSKNSLLAEDPKILLEMGNYYHVPTIIGVAKNEGFVVLSRSDLMNYIQDDVGGFLLSNMHMDKNSSKFLEVEQKIKNYYFHNLSITSELLNEYIDICGDVEFLIGIQKSIDYFIRNSTVPIYVEKFAHIGEFNLKGKEKWPDLKIPDGPGHAEDASYLFHNYQSKNLSNAESEIKTVKLYTSMVSSFATYKDPTQNGDTEWKATQKDNPNYLLIGNSTVQVSDTILTHPKLQFWNGINSVGSK